MSHEMSPPNVSVNRRVIPVGPHGFGRCTRAAADHASGLVARDPPEAVVAEDQAELAVVLRSADIGPVGCRGELDRGDPPAGRDHERRSPRIRDAACACEAGCQHTAGTRCASAGTTRKAWSIFVMKPKPTSAPASTSQRGLERSIARTVAYALAVSSSTRRASGLL